jgi:hypothetical protein
MLCSFDISPPFVLSIQVAIIPNAARLNGLPEGYLDTAFGYHFDLDSLSDEYDPIKHAATITPVIAAPL